MTELCHQVDGLSAFFPSLPLVHHHHYHPQQPLKDASIPEAIKLHSSARICTYACQMNHCRGCDLWDCRDIPNPALMSSAVHAGRGVQGNQMEYINIHLMAVIVMIARMMMTKTMIYLNECIILSHVESAAAAPKRNNSYVLFRDCDIPLPRILVFSCKARSCLAANCS